MTNERAIELLNRISDSQFDGPHGDERREALEMAVRALEQNLVQESGGLVKDLVKDCISREAVLDAIDKYILGKPEGCTVEVKELLKLITKIYHMPIYRMPSAQPQWIPCSERLPEEERYVLVTASNGAVTEAKYWQKERIWVKGLSIVSVTAWMPLPKGYKGE